MSSAVPQILQTKAINIDSVSWTPISAPMDCNFLYVLIEGPATYIRTDSADANTGKLIPSNDEWTPTGGGYSGYSGMKSRFQKDQTVAYAQASSGTATLKVTGLL